MKLITVLNNISNKEKVVTIGNFDGVHKGHQMLINTTLEISKANNYESAILTFDNLPEEVFEKSSFKRLYDNKLKARYIEELGIDTLLQIDFNELKNISHTSFCEDILMNKLNVKHVVVGDNFRFGKDRSGNIETLKKYRDSGMTLHCPKLAMIDGENISSSRIRKLLIKGEFKKAELCLGRKYLIKGVVTHGEQLGRKLGFPTANIKLEHDYPLSGVFITATEISGNIYPSLTSIGSKPTYNGTENILEVYIFDFSQDIYEEIIEVTFFEKIRDQIKFHNQDELIKQMNEDYKYAIINIKKYGL